MHLKGGAHDKR
ncbi:Protein of unknown function [Bacillus wiedmannii]|nr:Protein of unknown function [Bacillus wiedmannii]